MRYCLGLPVVGFLLGVTFLPGGVGSALTCSDIQTETASVTTPSSCQQVGTWDDESKSRYHNNHGTDDIQLAFIDTAWLSNVVQDDNPREPAIYPTNWDFVEAGTNSIYFYVHGKRVDQCSTLAVGWTTKVSLAGYPVCEGTAHNFTFSFDCCE